MGKAVTITLEDVSEVTCSIDQVFVVSHQDKHFLRIPQLGVQEYIELAEYERLKNLIEKQD